METIIARIRKVHVLATTKGTTSEQELMQLLDDPHHRVRREAVIALAGFEGEDSLKGLLKALHDIDRDVREIALYSLLKRKDKHAEGQVITLLDDEDAGIRIGALQVLSRIGGYESLEPVCRLKNDKFLDVREEAGRAELKIRKNLNLC